MDLVTCHCRNTRCAQCGKMGNASALQPHGSDRGEVRLRCMACGDVVSARTGTAEHPPSAGAIDRRKQLRSRHIRQGGL